MFDPYMHDLARWLGYSYAFELRAWLSVLLVSLICGMVGAQVIGSRMAFFSDAMAHCAFAGVALGLVLTLLTDPSGQGAMIEWFVPLVMVAFSGAVGIGIAFVRERTELASDTVIGVFFAGALGFAALLLTALRARSRFDPETFLFGNPWNVTDFHILYLLVLLGLTLLLLWWRYNDLVFATFNESLARSRDLPLRANSYLFILLLALVVNFSLWAVGVLLINGLLLVPAAAASNIARNMRQMFWLTLGVSVGCGMTGLWLSTRVRIPLGRGEPLEFGPSGPILLLCVAVFFASMLLPPLLRLLRARPAGAGG
ncbi:MAG TPA: metal ABC transporter permease [Gemmataceae bacterium]